MQHICSTQEAFAALKADADLAALELRDKGGAAIAGRADGERNDQLARSPWATSAEGLGLTASETSHPEHTASA